MPRWCPTERRRDSIFEDMANFRQSDRTRTSTGRVVHHVDLPFPRRRRSRPSVENGVVVPEKTSGDRAGDPSKAPGGGRRLSDRLAKTVQQDGIAAPYQRRIDELEQSLKQLAERLGRGDQGGADSSGPAPQD